MQVQVYTYQSQGLNGLAEESSTQYCNKSTPTGNGVQRTLFASFMITL